MKEERKDWELMTAEERRDMWRAIWEAAKVLLLCIAIISLAVLCSGCKGVEYVTVESVKHDTLTVERTLKDSVWVHDSVYQERWMVGDTVFVYKYKELVKWKDRVKLDSVYLSKVDSVPVPYEVVKEVKVEKPLRWYQKLMMGVGMVSLALVALYMTYIVGGWKRFVK